jgi:hypothetical protein
MNAVGQAGQTPAPWHGEPAPSASSMRSVRAQDGKAVAFINRGPAAEANERLIIAAPTLLAIVQKLAARNTRNDFLIDAARDAVREVSGS